MRLALLNDKAIGQKLEMPVFSPEGTVILSKGSVLTDRLVARLKQMGITTVYIADEGYEDVVVQELLDTTLRLKAAKLLRQNFELVKTKKDINPYAIREIVKDILDSIDISENSIIISNSPGGSEPDICSHSLNVTLLSILVGTSKGYNSSQLTELSVGAVLHDIGKLLAEEKSHPEAGFQFLRDYREFTPTSNICVYSHHENVDGTGYPRKAKGDQIHEYARIVSICDAYDRLSSTGKLMPHEVLERITAEVGKRFDSDIYKEFMKVIYCYPNGLPVKLSNGVEGVVVMQNKSFPQRPVVKNKSAGSAGYINLMENLNVFIQSVAI